MLGYARAVAGIHPWLGGAAIVVCATAAFVGGFLYWRGRGAGPITTHLLSLAQTLLVAQVGVGLLLLADDRRAPEQLHYLYGTLALAVALAPWFYAPESGPRRLLWFAATTGVAGALAGGLRDLGVVTRGRRRQSDGATHVPSYRTPLARRRDVLAFGAMAVADAKRRFGGPRP